ncbi:MAG TPA: tetratricopeptide repeat protein [Candidatus Competibacter sp.]|nr:tetratricopeptide repeat protein [Candidatus Competibacteraceae bacterium]HRW64226.1 tetratricopeptide repeat protein [Candidatus Competibacter sp.]
MMDKQRKIQVTLDQASELLDQHRYEEAHGLYTQICQENPEDAGAWSGLAVACLRLRRFPECRQAVTKALSLNSLQVQPYLIGAAAASQMGRHAEAIQAVDAALTFAPDHLQALNSKAGALLSQQRYAEVLPLMERALRNDPANTTAQLNRGVALHGMGQSLAALEVFDQLLVSKPDHANALMNRSSVLIALERPEEAIQAADAALRIQPDAIIALLNRTAALLSLRKPREALAAVDRLLQLKPRHIKGLINKAVALLALRNYEPCLTTLLTVLTFDTFNPDALEIKVQALLGLGRFAEALAEGNKALSRYPDRSVLKLATAKALMGLQRVAEAESCLDTVLATTTHQPEAVSLKAEILFGRNEWDAGRTLIEQALIEHPADALLWVAKSVILLATEHYTEALVAIEHALALEPNQSQAAINRIAALNGLHRFAEALAAAWELLEQGVRDWQIYANQAGALAGLERFEEARQAFATARELDKDAFRAFRGCHEVYGMPPDALVPDPEPCAEYLAFKLKRLERGDWREYEATVERAQDLIAQMLAAGQPTPIPPFKSLLLPFSPGLTTAIARSRGEFLAEGMAAARQQLAFFHPVVAAERLRIGYVSADFRNHPTAHLMRGLFRLHDRERFETCIYALCGDDGSDYYQRIKADADRFVDLAGASNADIAARIHVDGIHILIDLMGYTAYARSEVFALQPAPVQVSYLGYPGTMGAPFMPYIIADPIVLPEELRCCFSENPIYLPECYQVNDRWQEIAETGIRRVDQDLPEQGFVFCCFNQIQKLEPILFSIWMRILHRVPDSVLWLYSENEEARDNLRATATACGVAGERLVFAKRLSKDRHLERHRLADLFLDTRIYGAHTTASDALWAGLPVLTCMGETFPARVAASLLQAMEIPELITHSLEEYEEQAVQLATRPADLTLLRDKLTYNRLRTSLFDTERFVRHLERAYELVWDRHVRGLSPAPLHVPALPAVNRGSA